MPFNPNKPIACPGNPPSCDVADYRRLAVSFDAAPAGRAAAERPPSAAQDPRAAMTSGTPTGPAVLAARRAAVAPRSAANPGRRGALVVVTDGEPTLCDPVAVDGIAGPVAAARQASPPISTFVIGVFTPEEIARGAGNVVARLAMAGGTTEFVINPTNDLNQPAAGGLQPRSAPLAVPCAFTIPQPRAGTIDYGKVNVHVTGASRDEDSPTSATPPAATPPAAAGTTTPIPRPAAHPPACRSAKPPASPSRATRPPR